MCGVWHVCGMCDHAHVTSLIAPRVRAPQASRRRVRSSRSSARPSQTPRRSIAAACPRRATRGPCRVRPCCRWPIGSSETRAPPIG
eukprot:2260431-Prymnesium_polylepis.1